MSYGSAPSDEALTAASTLLIHLITSINISFFHIVIEFADSTQMGDHKYLIQNLLWYSLSMNI